MYQLWFGLWISSIVSYAWICFPEEVVLFWKVVKSFFVFFFLISKIEYLGSRDYPITHSLTL